MAKVVTKNENITSFGGIYHIMDVFSKMGFEKLTESVLGKRRSSGKAFCYGSIFDSLFFSYLCGGKSLDNSLIFSIFASITVCFFVFKISCLRLLIYKENSTNCYFSIYLFGWETLEANNTHVKNIIISVQLRCERPDKRGEDSLALSILPSDFLMCNEKRVLTDSLRIVLKKAKRK